MKILTVLIIKSTIKFHGCTSFFNSAEEQTLSRDVLLIMTHYVAGEIEFPARVDRDG